MIDFVEHIYEKKKQTVFSAMKEMIKNQEKEADEQARH